VETLVQKLLARTGLLTIAEVSDLLGFHEVTLRNWVRAGKLPAVRIGSVWRFDPVEIAVWLEARRMR
jgi:excisionase family DNA binding protein